MADTGRARTAYRCSFCGKGQERVHRLIAGPGGVYICSECVDLCNEIIGTEERPFSSPPGKTGSGWRSFARRAPEDERLREEALSLTHTLANLVASRDYESAVPDGERLLELVRILSRPQGT